ncbi:MAG: hypothetical protein NW226_23155 [Microscillaceae bacterium]|nr:hypothetical protein [Microscillaceae bacterium]
MRKIIAFFLIFWGTLTLLSARTLVVGLQETYKNPQEAFEACQDGDEIKILAGNYLSEQTYAFTHKKNVKIYGVGKVWLLCEEPSFDVFRVVACRNVILENIKMKHLQPDILDKAEDSCGGSVLVVESCQNLQIRNCELNGCGRIGINFAFSEDHEAIVLENNKIHQNSLCALMYRHHTYFRAEDMKFPWLTFKKNMIKNNG